MRIRYWSSDVCSSDLQLLHVGLAMAAAERVQLQELARQILIQADRTPGPVPSRLLRHRAVGADGARLIEIDQHGGVPLDRQQQVGEAAEDVRPDCFELQGAGDRKSTRLNSSH